jgi:polysaccharide biosynthesis transport protein
MVEIQKNGSMSVSHDGAERPGDRRVAGARRNRNPGKRSAGRLRVVLEEETPEFVEYWRAIMLRKWSILALVVGSALITTVVVFHMTPVYRSTATVLVDIDNARPVLPMGGTEMIHLGSYYREYLQTQAEVLKSRAIAQRVIADLQLTEHREFQPQPSALKQRVSAMLAWPSAETPEKASREAAVFDQYAAQLRIEPVRLSQLIKVSFEARDAELAAAVANATARAYVQSDLEARQTANQDAEQLLAGRLAGLKEALDASERAVQAYREREGLLDSKSTVLSGNAKQLDEVIHQFAQARARRIEVEQAYNQARSDQGAGYDSLPAVFKSASVQRAKDAEAEAERKIAELREHYGPEHPRLLMARSELRATKENTVRQMRLAVASIAREYEAARANEQSLQNSLAQAKRAIQGLNRTEMDLGVLEQEAAASRQLYQAYLSRSKESSVTKDAQVAHARVVDPAVAKLIPTWPAKTPVITIVASLSLFLGVVGALLMRRFGNTVRTSVDVEQKLRQTFLAALPAVRCKVDARELFNAEANQREHKRSPLDRERRLYAESICTASTSLWLSGLEGRPKILTVTSCVRGEGKSTFAMSFACSQARTSRVLLLEGDLREPRIAKEMKVPAKGLTDLLVGNATLDEIELHIDGIGLTLIVAGASVANPVDLLTSERFRSLLAVLAARYDLVVIDSPPLQAVSDALVLARQSTGVVFIVKADATPIPLARTALNRLTSADVPVFGVILNQQDFKKAAKYYGEHSASGRYEYGAADFASNSRNGVGAWVSRSLTSRRRLPRF